MLRYIAVTIVSLSIGGALGAARCGCAADVDWPGWLGDNRDGWIANYQPPEKWPSQITRQWQVDVGTGYGSPVVAGEHVYQHARLGDEEVVWCFELATGAVKWRKSYAAPFTIGGGGDYHGKGPKSSPALADGRLFTLSIGGVLSAWDANTGELLWRRDAAAEFAKGHPYWGAATSPLVDGDRVIVHLGTDDQGALLALDVKTGQIVWRHGNDGASYASPILVEIDGQRQVIELNMRAVVSVDCQTGRKLWEFPYPQVGTDQNMVTPAYWQGLVLVGGENRGIRAIAPRRSGEEWNVEQRWHQEKVALDMSTAVINGDMLYGFSHYGLGQLFCLNPKTGDVRWEGPGRTGKNVMFLSMPGYVAALIDNGELRILAANAESYQPVAAYRVSDAATWAPPVFLKQGILVKDKETLSFWTVE